MERKQEIQEVERWVQSSSISINGDDNHDEGLCFLKREIASHSLYSLLVESHFNCLKVCLGEMENIENVIDNESTAFPNQHPNLFTDPQSELDQFMEAYCVTLKKLKEEMEEPQQESLAFINLMYSQIDTLLPEVEKAEVDEARDQLMKCKGCL